MSLLSPTRSSSGPPPPVDGDACRDAGPDTLRNLSAEHVKRRAIA
jgi:hypothetical protein